MDAVMAPLVELRGVSARYGWGAPWVLRNIDARVAAGTLLKVRGPNGSGKSTLLRLLAGATVPTRGRRLEARTIAVGYAPERLSAPPPFSAAEYLRQQRRLRPRARADGERTIAELADRLALTSLLGERLDALSRGSLQKVVLIQALLGAPDVLILDEPFNGLDLEAQDAVAAILAERRSAGSAVVWSDHRALDASPVADVVWHVGGAQVHVHAATTAEAVLERDDADSRVSLVVVAGESDQTLVALVEEGWHIESVSSTLAGGAVRVEAHREPW
jgi:ABC-type multidrug transport system ATPase subunit